MAKDQSIVPPLAPSGRGLSAKPIGGEKSLWRLSLRRPAGDTSLTEGGKREGQSPSPTHFVSDGLLLSVATKVTKNAIQGERDFDLPLPFGKPHPGVGRGERIATTSLRTGLAMTPLRGVSLPPSAQSADTSLAERGKREGQSPSPTRGFTKAWTKIGSPSQREDSFSQF